MARPNRSIRRNEHQSPLKRRQPSALLIAIIIGILAVGALGTYERMLHASDVAAATRTPTPNGALGKGVALVDGAALGAGVLPPGDAFGGGQGQTVDDIQCSAQEYAAFHVHAHVAIFVNGKQVQLPAQIGFPSNGKACLYWLHTHDASGIVHVESPLYRAFTLGNFFDIWGQPLATDRVATFRGPVHAFVNGSRYDGDLRTIPLSDHQQITLDVGMRSGPPPTYLFPAGDI